MLQSESSYRILGSLLMISCLALGATAIAQSTFAQTRNHQFDSLGNIRAAYNSFYHTGVPEIVRETIPYSSVVVPKAGFGVSPNLTTGQFRDYPVEIETDCYPVQITFGAGVEKRFRGRPLLYNRSGKKNVNDEVLIPETRAEHEKPSDSTGGGADDAPMSVHEPSAAAVNAAAFSKDAVPQPEAEKKNYISKRDVPTILGTADFHRFNAERFRNQQRWVDAAEEYAAVLAACPGDTASRARHAETNWMAGRRDLASSEFRSLMRVQDAEAQFLCGNWLRETGKNDEAVHAYQNAISLKKDNVRALNNMGVTYMNLNEDEKAKETFLEVLKIDSAFENALLNLGVLYDDVYADPVQAIPYYESYLKVPGALRKGEVRLWLSEAQKKIKD